ncbi:hypothetical protein PL8927_140251 [Planktothrix serta PCC 8927]|uniref:Uncharacterized protein n=1 Tax=Planktothrix serta PCC 8927 TaxID=671068 RepID=A0A7Z9DW38_9CYAN|nr:hypothetical protein PL8927_140251 [Planktothrix serta PCC 8927]
MFHYGIVMEYMGSAPRTLCDGAMGGAQASHLVPHQSVIVDQPKS